MCPAPMDAPGGEQSGALNNRLGLGVWWKGICGEHFGLNKGSKAAPGQARLLVTALMAFQRNSGSFQFPSTNCCETWGSCPFWVPGV